MPLFNHERLDAYRVRGEFMRVATEIVRELPRGHAHLADQLQRAAISITLNIAEGAGECSAKDKSRFYRMANRSATECAAILDVCEQLGLIDAERYGTGRDLLFRIVSMLTKMVTMRR